MLLKQRDHESRTNCYASGNDGGDLPNSEFRSMDHPATCCQKSQNLFLDLIRNRQPGVLQYNRRPGRGRYASMFILTPHPRDFACTVGRSAGTACAKSAGTSQTRLSRTQYVLNTTLPLPIR
ncbi:MAG: hypothetical protein JWP44_4972 [Mucilaginibacter sp.]|nr:hypothetical protein [Mucilaginibacter sp.]